MNGTRIKLKHFCAAKETIEKSLGHVQLFAIPWTIVYQASLSMVISRQEYWSGLPFPSPGDPGIELGSHALQADDLPSELPGKPPGFHYLRIKTDQICSGKNTEKVQAC